MTLIMALVLISGIALSAAAQNPLLSKRAPQQEAVPSSSLMADFLDKITAYQQELRTRMVSYIEKRETENDITPFLVLLMLSFGYGVLHAMGPGHGKAIALSYILTRRCTISSGILFANALAFFHGLSGIVFILIVKLILSASISNSLERVTQITQMISFGLIVCLGVFIISRTLYEWILKKPHSHEHDHLFDSTKGRMGTALLMGLVPCPGVVMVMLFALSTDMTFFSVIMGLAISFGMAVTITVTVILGTMAKNVSLNMIRENKWHTLAEHGIHLSAGVMVAILGGLFFAASLRSFSS